MPDHVIYKPCGNRRTGVCPSCSKVYQRDAYQIVRSLLVGGKGVPATVATHPAVLPTLTAPSFGPVHARVVVRHTCKDRRRCDCRPQPCHARRDTSRCSHGRLMACFARHDDQDRVVGTPLCLDCYDYDAQVVWNNVNGELWRRTRITIERFLHARAAGRGIDPRTVKFAYGRRTVNTTGPEPDGQTPEQEIVLVVNFLQFVGAGWHTARDAMLATAAADLAPSRVPTIEPVDLPGPPQRNHRRTQAAS